MNKLSELLEKIAFEVLPDKTYRLMEFCGGHTYVLAKNALEQLLPKNIEMVHGPGCPVCVIPCSRIDMALELASYKDVIFCAYGDVLRVPNAKGESLFTVKGQGSDVRIVYSLLDALKIAKDNPSKKIVFFAIGFETTAPLSAAALEKARQDGIDNFFLFLNHLLTLPAMRAVLAQGARVDGVIAPGHVCVITGTKSFEPLAREFKKPLVATGFEAYDMLSSILLLVRQINEGSYDVQNEYLGVLNPDGNKKALELLDRVFPLREDFSWRGLGKLEKSAFAFADEYAKFDASKVFKVKEKTSAENKACECGNIVRGIKKPSDCPLFGSVCTPSNPVGACMVSGEGACGAYYKYKV